ncbi:hypothetical protein SNN53_004035 [Cronobacter sakazakii]|nr:hypothetical protein [Cronobacter sakazakii]ELY7751554.1 hypothetical protein [Cronobacter sakazakii]ELZ1661179.1 hypothetical protein [Cronobacter sakazakii]
MDQIRLAGRVPVVEGGGEFTMEGGQSSYPKVYDMKAMSDEVQGFALNKYGRLHVNTSDSLCPFILIRVCSNPVLAGLQHFPGTYLMGLTSKASQDNV